MKLDTSVNNSIGVILIGNSAVVNISLGTTLMEGKRDTLERIMAIPHLKQYTNTADGLCQLTTQRWRNDSSVLKLAIVLTDGQSSKNFKSSEKCGKVGTKEMATLLHEDYPDILVFTVGIGRKVNRAELLSIASRNHLMTHLKTYHNLHSMPATLHYQICSTSMNLSHNTKLIICFYHVDDLNSPL